MREVLRNAIGQDHVVVSTGDYVGKLWAAPKSGGAPIKLADHGEAFDLADGTVVWADRWKVQRWSEATATTTVLGSLPRPEWVQDLATNGTDVFLAYRDSRGIGVLRPGSPTVEPYWAGERDRVARITIGGPGLVVRENSWAGYAYVGYARQLTVLDASPTATRTADFTSTMSSNVFFAADATDAFYGTRDGLWKLPLAGGPPTKLWDGPMVYSVALDGPDVYFATCLAGGRRAARGMRIPKSGGPAVEVVFDEIAAPAKDDQIYFCNDRPSSRYLATDAQYIYWVHGTTVRRVPK